MRRRIMAVLTVGLLVLSMTGCKSIRAVYQPIEADGISFICDGKAVVNIQKYEIVVD